MSLAARTRAAVRKNPFLLEALRAGVVNYTALARYLDVGDPDAVAAALRRFADDLGERPDSGTAQVRMQRGVGRVDANDSEGVEDAADSEGVEDANDSKSGVDAEGVLSVNDVRFALDGGSSTAILATGDPSPIALARAIERCAIQDIDVVAAGVAAALVLVVDQRDGPNALRAVEGVFDD